MEPSSNSSFGPAAPIPDTATAPRIAASHPGRAGTTSEFSSSSSGARASAAAALLAAANPRLPGITAIVNESACRLCRPRSRNSSSARCSGLSST